MRSNRIPFGLLPDPSTIHPPLRQADAPAKIRPCLSQNEFTTLKAGSSQTPNPESDLALLPAAPSR